MQYGHLYGHMQVSLNNGRRRRYLTKNGQRVKWHMGEWHSTVVSFYTPDTSDAATPETAATAEPIWKKWTTAALVAIDGTAMDAIELDGWHRSWHPWDRLLAPHQWMAEMAPFIDERWHDDTDLMFVCHASGTYYQGYATHLNAWTYAVDLHALAFFSCNVPRRVALAMARHIRLGASSPLRSMPRGALQKIAMFSEDR